MSVVLTVYVSVYFMFVCADLCLCAWVFCIPLRRRHRVCVVCVCVFERERGCVREREKRFRVCVIVGARMKMHVQCASFSVAQWSVSASWQASASPAALARLGPLALRLLGARCCSISMWAYACACGC